MREYRVPCGMTYRLYGADVSYFTGKVRAYLRWKGVDFIETPATRDVYRDIILPRVGWPVIPVLVDPDDVVVQDSTDIIAHVEAREGGPSVYPSGPVQQLVTLLIDLLADEWLKLPAMHYRWNYNEDWVLAEFGRLSRPDLSPEEQKEVGHKTGARFRESTSWLGVTPATIPGVEASYEGFLSDFSAHLGEYPYLLGSRPSFGDFALMGPLYAHLYRDPKSGEMMKARAPRVANWVERCNQSDGHSGGELLADDTVPATLKPILARQMAEQLPSLQATLRDFQAWLDKETPSEGERVPRAVGKHSFTIGGHTGERASVSFALYRLQAVLDHLAGLHGQDKDNCLKLLTDVGGGVIADIVFPRRLERRQFQLSLGD